jgi:SnoaL-like protein
MTNDAQAIANLVYSYAEMLDIGDLEGLGSLFAGAVVRMAGSDHEFRGAAAVRSLIEETVRLYDGIPGTKHLVTNLIIEVDSNRESATARSSYLAVQGRPDLPLQPILAGRWHDTFENVEDRWQFVDRVIHNDLIGDVSCHLKGFSN